MSLHGNSGYLAINNSNKIYAINTRNIKVTGDITGLHTPRYIHIVNDEKAYVTSGFSQEISIFKPKTLEITGKINTAPYTTEKIIQDNDTKRIFVSTSWNSNKEVHNNKILVIDPQTDTLEKSIETKTNPTGGIQIDINKKLWALQGSWDSQSYLTRIDLSTDEKLHIPLPTGIHPSRLSINASKNTLYWIAGNRVWRMPVNDTTAPTEAFISPTQAQTIYGLGIDPKNEDIYVVDALNYQQSGKLYRYSNTGILIDSATTGILPQAFAFPSFN